MSHTIYSHVYSGGSEASTSTNSWVESHVTATHEHYGSDAAGSHTTLEPCGHVSCTQVQAEAGSASASHSLFQPESQVSSSHEYTPSASTILNPWSQTTASQPHYVAGSPESRSHCKFSATLHVTGSQVHNGGVGASASHTLLVPCSHVTSLHTHTGSVPISSVHSLTYSSSHIGAQVHSGDQLTSHFSSVPASHTIASHAHIGSQILSQPYSHSNAWHAQLTPSHTISSPLGHWHSSFVG